MLINIMNHYKNSKSHLNFIIMMKVQNLDENSSVFDKFFTEFEINQGYKNSYLMKTINFDEHSKL